MAQQNGKIKRLSDEELAALSRPPAIADREDRRAAVERATTGLRVDVRVTRSMYRPR